MFKKKPNIKPLAPLRSSDRRRTADQIIKDLALPEISVPETATAEEKAAAVAERAKLRNSLLPDNALSARFTTTHGPELKQVSGTVYVGSHGGEEQRVLWVRIEEKMYPTVYTLWQNPGILPLIHCGSNVIERLKGGADLMTPGLVYGPPFPENAKQGALVAVAGHNRPSVPVVVGTCDIDISELKQVQGSKGRAVLTAHWAGDELWSWSANGNPGGSTPEHLDGWLKGDEAEELRERIEKFELKEVEDTEGGVALPAADVKPTNGVLSFEPEVAEEDAREMTTKEVDDAFLNAILYGINTFKSTHPKTPNFGLEFPLTQSFIMANLVNPFLPTFTPQQTAQLQIKKTSWKNIKKFVKSLDKLQILKAKDQGTHEVVILDIDFTDRHILEFKPYRLPKREVAIHTKTDAVEEQGAGDPSIGQTIKLISLYRPKDKLAELFETTKKDPRGYYTAAEIKTIVTTYIELEELVPANNKRLVNLNPFLANQVFDARNGAMDKEILSKGFSPREAVSERVLSSCAPFHVIQRSAGLGTEKPKAGAPPRIQILLETRSGNKTVTKVSGLEAYYISPQPLADELRKVCAGSTSVERLQASSPKNPIMEVMVQGPQREAVVKALERRGVDRKWVEVVDKVKKKK